MIEACQLQELRKVVEGIYLQDVNASEFRWALFCSALASYKRDSLLKPFPHMFMHDSGDKNFNELEHLTGSMSSLSKVDFKSLGHDHLALLNWVFEPNRFSLHSISVEAIKGLLAQCGPHVPCPTHAFEVSYSDVSNKRFEADQSGRRVLLAFHGSRLANFHSILHHGLVSNLNKTAVFGEGTYLSKHLSVSLNWSPPSQPGCAKCAIGSRLSCVALCEVIDDSRGVKYETRSEPIIAPVSASRVQRVPETYLIVQNDNLVRVKYVLVFAEKERRWPSWGFANRTCNWFAQYKFWLVMACYFLVLVVAGVANSSRLQFYLRRWTQFYNPPSFDET